MSKNQRVIPSEAVYTFAAWLTTRRGEPVTLGAKYDAAPIAELVAEFCEINGLKPPREGIYPDNMKMPADPETWDSKQNGTGPLTGDY